MLSEDNLFMILIVEVAWNFSVKIWKNDNMWALRLWGWGEKSVINWT